MLSLVRTLVSQESHSIEIVAPVVTLEGLVLEDLCVITHSYAPWILDTTAFDHIYGNKVFFSSLTFPSPLPTITLTNGSQTIAKGIGSACSLPSLPFTSVLYVHEFFFNLISISKLTRDLHCVLTFPHL